MTPALGEQIFGKSTGLHESNLGNQIVNRRRGDWL